MTPGRLSLWWLSYAASDTVSNGVCVVEARSFFRACQRARELGISPGGQVRGFAAPRSEEAALRPYLNQHLSPEQARKLAGQTPS